MTAKLNPPQPEPSLDSLPYWESLKAGVFALQRCTACREWQFPPLDTCRHCAGSLSLQTVSGRGTIYTFIINHRPSAPGFDELLPYPVALVAPEEAPHLHIPGRIVGAANEDIAIGRSVMAEVVDHPGGEWKVPVFRIIAT
ncbi:MAG: OB-fold domain-containing protein [Alphaproteobacteria bacterium]|nr:OB-fold domain-containing protein [Alphaproteobacteria bacterium]